MPYVFTQNLVGPNTGPMGAQYLGAIGSQYMAGQAGQGYSPFGWDPRTVNWGVVGGGANSGGTDGVSPYNIPGQFQQAYNDARAANEQRYNDILTGYQDRHNNLMAASNAQRDDVLGGYEGRYQRGMTNLQGLGRQELADTNQRYDQMQAQNYQDLVDRGMSNSSTTPTMRQGVERQRADALSRVNERLNRERMGWDASLSGEALDRQAQLYDRSNLLYGGTTGDTLGFAERRTDSYPDPNQLAALAQAYGAGGGLAGQYGASPSNYVSPQEMGYQVPQIGPNGQLGGIGGGQWNFANPGAMNNWVMPVANRQNPNVQNLQFNGQPTSTTSAGGGGGTNVSPYVSAAFDDTAVWDMADQIRALLGRDPESFEEAQMAVDAILGGYDTSYANPATQDWQQPEWGAFGAAPTRQELMLAGAAPLPGQIAPEFGRPWWQPGQ